MLRNFEAHPMLLLVLIVLVVLLFGAKRLPDAARSVGRSMRIFKSEVKEMKDDGKTSSSSTSSASAESEGTPSRPLEGRVVDEPRREQTTTPTYDQQRHSA